MDNDKRKEIIQYFCGFQMLHGESVITKERAKVIVNNSKEVLNVLIEQNLV